jgi:hypothetical protein
MSFNVIINFVKEKAVMGSFLGMEFLNICADPLNKSWDCRFVL